MIETDEIDDRILQTLSADGRISNIDLAECAGLSPSACLRRVQNLERIGVIRGYKAVLDGAHLGRGFIAYITVGLSDHTTASQAAFEAAIAKAPEVVECHNVTGAVEFLLRVEVADLVAYKTFHAETLGKLPQVNALTTFVVMASSKDLRA